jgi:hypothetical protein
MEPHPKHTMIETNNPSSKQQAASRQQAQGLKRVPSTQVSKALSKRPNIDANIKEVPKQASLNVMSVNARIKRIERIEAK